MDDQARHKTYLCMKMSLRELSEILLRNVVHVKYSNGRLFKMKIRTSYIKVIIAYKEIHVTRFVDNDEIKTH